MTSWRQGAKPVDVLTGFVNDRGEAHGRPVGVIAEKAGALLVANDVRNAIWRVGTAADARKAVGLPNGVGGKERRFATSSLRA